MRSFKTGGHMYALMMFGKSYVRLSFKSEAVQDTGYIPDKVVNHMFNHSYIFTQELTKEQKKMIQNLLQAARDFRINQNLKKSKKED